MKITLKKWNNVKKFFFENFYFKNECENESKENHAHDREKGFLIKSVLKTYGREAAMPTSWDLSSFCSRKISEFWKSNSINFSVSWGLCNFNFWRGDWPIQSLSTNGIIKFSSAKTANSKNNVKTFILI